jgi:hypothetical protein
MRDKSASVVMIAGANCDWNNIGELLDEGLDFTRLFHSGFGPEQVEQITGDTDEVEVWSLIDQPPKPVKAEMEVGGDEELHRFGKWSYKVVEKSFIVAGPESSERTHCLSIHFL